MKIDINLKWHRYAQGYEIQPKKKGDPNGLTIMHTMDTPERIIGRGKEIQYDFGDKCLGAYSEFMNVESPQQLLNFVEKYGLLHQNGFFTDAGLTSAKNMKMVKKNRHGYGIPLGPTEIILKFDAKGNPRLEIIPRSLEQALWLQYGETISNNQNPKECQLCGKIFMTGSRKTSRRDSKFCCPEHRQKYNNDMRKSPVKKATPSS